MRKTLFTQYARLFYHCSHIHDNEPLDLCAAKQLPIPPPPPPDNILISLCRLLWGNQMLKARWWWLGVAQWLIQCCCCWWCCCCWCKCLLHVKLVRTSTILKMIEVHSSYRNQDLLSCIYKNKIARRHFLVNQKQGASIVIKFGCKHMPSSPLLNKLA